MEDLAFAHRMSTRGAALQQPQGQAESGSRPSCRHPKLTVATERSDSTAFGGLALAARLISRLGTDRAINEHLRLHRPYRESDHGLTHVYKLFAGGAAIEDIADLQLSEPIRRILGGARIPDPTTAGDVLHRLDRRPIGDLDRAIDQVQKRVWKKQRASLVDSSGFASGRRNRPLEAEGSRSGVLR